MKAKIIPILFVLFSAVVVAQRSDDKLVFKEDFDNNSKQWLVESEDSRSSEISGGRYILKLTDENRSQAYWQKISFDGSAEWAIQTSIRKTGGSTLSDAFGLMWGVKDFNNCFRFLISNEDKITVQQVEDGKTSVLRDWRSFPRLVKSGEFNVLRIEYRCAALVFWLNGVPVYSADEQNYSDTKIGFYLEGNSTVEVDNLLVYEHAAQTPDVLKTSQPFGQRVNVGKSVNSELSDINPLISSDGSTLWFARYEQLKKGAEETEQIWYSTKKPDGTWNEAVKAAPPLNNSSHCFVISVSPDNNTLLLANQYAADGTPDGPGLSISQRTMSNWEVPKAVLTKNRQNFNRYVAHCLSADRKVLLSAVERDETRGGRDLYVSFLEDDGTWTEPKSLGNQINTAGDEDSPFLSADGRTLYYSTNGMPGYGMADIFITRRIGESWTNWSNPKNLGPDVNTRNFDSYFTLPATGDKAYVVSWESKDKKLDIYTIALPLEARPNPVVLVRGKVFDSKTLQPIATEVRYELLESGKDAGVASSAPGSGEYRIILPAGAQYGFRAEKQGYFPVSDNLDTRGIDKYTELNRDLYLVPIETGATIRINNLFFDFAKSSLRPESHPELDRVVKFMREATAVQIEIQGHTDNVGGDASNQKLSEDRAVAVVQYLVEKGVEAKRMTSKGFGKRKPLTTNDTEEGRQQNRRVVFVITKK